MSTSLSGARAAIPASIATGHHAVEWLEIHGAKHFRDLRLDIPTGLSVLIGVRGSGKSTVLQCMRHGIGVPATGPRAEQFEAMTRGVLAQGRVRAGVRTRHGLRYASECTATEAPRVTDEEGNPVAATLDGELFGLEMYSQTQIELMARSAGEQLRLIDKFAESEIRDLTASIGGMDRKLVATGTAILRLGGEIDTLEARVVELPGLAAALASLVGASGRDAGGTAIARDGRIDRGRERAALARTREELRAVRGLVDALEQESRRRLSVDLEPAIARGLNRETLAEVAAGAGRAMGVIAEAAARMRAVLTESEVAAGRAGDTLAGAHATQEERDQADARRRNEDRDKAMERERLQKRILDLEAITRKLDDRRLAQAAACETRLALQRERAGLVAARLAARRRVADQLDVELEGRVQVGVQAGSDFGPFLTLLTALLKGANIRPPELIEHIARNIRPEDLIECVLRDDTRPIEAIDESKTAKTERAQKVLNALRASDRLFELDTVTLGDVPALKVEIDGRHEPILEVSTGQASTAILAILLLQSEKPLLIDEPEHFLDNRYIYDVFVKNLLRAKKTRQIIFVTHNPNIPVLAEAERVFVFEESKGEARLVECGTVDEVRAAIERILEGGREAFLRRSERYGHR